MRALISLPILLAAAAALSGCGREATPPATSAQPQKADTSAPAQPAPSTSEPPPPAAARPPDEPGSYEVISNTKLQADLESGGKTVKVRGQMSMYVHYAPSVAATGRIEVRTLDVTFFDVPQEALSGVKPKKGKGTGFLSFSLPFSEEPPKARLLRYDPHKHVVTGLVEVAAHFDQLDELAPPQRPKEDPYADYVRSRTIPGQFNVTLLLGGAPPQLTKEPGKGDLSGNATFQAFAEGGAEIRGFKVSIPDPPSEVTSGPSGPTRVLRKMCVQPVIIAPMGDPNPTGGSLTMLMGNAQTQWHEKAAILFDVKSPKPLRNAAALRKLMTGNGGKEDELLAMADDPLCVEVFFVDDFIPANFYFGANTYRPGLPGAKVIIAEKTGSLDPWVLAHELGHVMGLGHPVRPGGLFKSSTGTLMCSMKAGKPRPTHNSEDNIDNLKNGLTTLQLSMTTAPPDCIGSCGSCP